MDTADRPRSGMRKRLVLLLGGLLVLGAGCGGGDGGTGGPTGSGDLCILNVSIPGFFSYCAEYIGLSESQCTQSMGMFKAQCATGYVGYCDAGPNLNPRRTYFYGSAVTQQSVQSVCPGGKYVPGRPSGVGGP